MIKDLQNVLQILQSIGVEEVIIDPEEEGSLVRAFGANGSVVVYSQIEQSFSDHPIGVGSVRALLSRINLFDLDKASMTFREDEQNEWVRSVDFKQGNRKASFTFHNPKSAQNRGGIPAPIQKPESEEGNVITFDAEYVKYLNKAISAMSLTGEKTERTIYVEGDGDDLNVRITDGGVDSFSDVITGQGDGVGDGSWEVDPFRRVMDESAKNSDDDSASFVINEYGICTFDLCNLSAMVIPMTA